MLIKIRRLGFDFEIENDWLVEANLIRKDRSGENYNSTYDPLLFLVRMENICPKIRREGLPIFIDGKVNGIIKTARERTVSIL